MVCYDKQLCLSFLLLSFLVTIKSLMIPWSLTLALVDAFSVFIKRPSHQMQIVSVIIIGDWVRSFHQFPYSFTHPHPWILTNRKRWQILSFLSLAAACSTASVSVFMVTEAGVSFCGGTVCSRYLLSAAMACFSWCLTLASALFNLWLLPSLYSNYYQITFY